MSCAGYMAHDWNVDRSLCYRCGATSRTEPAPLHFHARQPRRESHASTPSNGPLAAALWGFHWTGDAAEMAQRLEAELNRMGYRIVESEPR